MSAIDTASPTRTAALTRTALTALLVVPIGFVGLGYAASGPVGMPMAIPTLYLLWVLGADAVALVRGAEGYGARPWYKWFVCAGVLVVAIWIGVLVAQGGTIFGWTPHVRESAASDD